MTNPLCFVVMPFGRKTDSLSGVTVDFDAVYSILLVPAAHRAGMEVIRADEEVLGGVVHKAMYERLILCDFAIADLTTANANVLYELGLRHAVRPWSTVSVFAEGTRLPFDVAPLRAMRYPLTAAGTPANAGATISVLTNRLEDAKRFAIDDVADSPVFQLVTGVRRQHLPHEVTDVFRERVAVERRVKESLARARRAGTEEVRNVQREIEEQAAIAHTDTAIVIDLLLSYRAVHAYVEMVALVEKVPRPLADTVLFREQYAFALNRLKRSEEAEVVLRALILERGPSAETYGLLGRVYKDRWEKAITAGQMALASGLLDQAITAYLEGFETDWRDAYPGVNAMTLMEVREPPDDRSGKILPVVSYAVQRKIAAGRGDYWDHAMLVELGVIGRDEASVGRALNAALALAREPWEPETTARNLRLIRMARERRGERLAWARRAEDELIARHESMQVGTRPEP